MKTAEKVAWAVGALGFAAAAMIGIEERQADGGGLIIAMACYAIGLHWIIAFLFGGTMYGALRLQPTHRLARLAVGVAGALLTFTALQYALGFGGMLA